MGEVHEYLSKVTSFFRVENWYPFIKDYTFQTQILDLSLEEANALLKYREIYIMAKRLKLDEKEYIDQSTLNMIDNIKEKLEKCLISYRENGKGAFVRLSTRSPKDSALSSQKMKEMLKEIIQKSQEKDPQSINAIVEDAIAYIQCSSWALEVKTGEEAVKLLMFSQRTYEDITRVKLELGEESFKMHIIIREWESILPEWEFRAFVFNKELTCVTQYYSMCYVPNMYEQKKKK